MIRLNVFCAAIISLAIYGQYASAAGGDHGTKPVNLSDPHLTDLANQPGRVGGYWVNSNDWFYFGGDTEALNDFLRRYAKLTETPLVLVIHPGKAPAERCVGELFDKSYDWKLDSMWPAFTRDKDWFQKPDGGQWQRAVIVGAWLGGNIRLEELKVRANIDVREGGEITEFGERHNRQRIRGHAQRLDRQQDVILRGAAESCRELCLDVDDDTKIEQIGGATSARCLRLAQGRLPRARWKLTKTDCGHLIQAQSGKFAGWYLDFDDDAEIGQMGGATSSRNLLLTKEKVPGAYWKLTETDRGFLIQAQAGRFEGWHLDLDLLTKEKVEGAFWQIEIVEWETEGDRESEPLVIDLIRAEGNMRETPSFWIGYEQLSREALHERATSLLKASPGREVVVRAGRAMSHGPVAELLELVKAVGANDVSLAVFPLDSVFAIDPGAGRDGTMRGKVIAPSDHRGRPVNYFVTLDNQAWANHGGERPTLEVAAGETFEFRNVPAGTYRVRARPVTASWQDTGDAAKTVVVEVIVKNKQVVEIELSFDQSPASAVWGKAVDGLQCRLHVEKTTLKAGQWPRLLVDVKNGGERELSLGEAPDFWELECDGTWYRASVWFSGDCKILELSPSNTSHRFPLLLAERWKWRAKNGDQPFALGPGKHVLRVALQPALKQEGARPRLVSNPVELEVVDQAETAGEKAPWGPATEDVRCRLRAKKRSWQQGRIPKLLADWQNDGTGKWEITLPRGNWELELDGSHHQPSVREPRNQRVLLEPGGQRQDLEVPILSNGNLGLKLHDLAPGKHTLRLIYMLNSTAADTARKPIRVASNLLVVDVLPVDDDIAWGKPVEGVRCRLRIDQRSWPRGTVPELFADLQNQGERELSMAIESESWEFEIDGTWHKPSVFRSGERRHLPLAAGQRQQNVEVWTDANRKLEQLEPGPHTLRVARILPSAVEGPLKEQIRVVSKLIEKGDRVVIGSAEVVDSTDTFLNSGTKLILRSAAPKEGLIFFGYEFNQADSHFWAIGMKEFQAAVGGYFTVEGDRE